jgi:hypothetical protein
MPVLVNRYLSWIPAPASAGVTTFRGNEKKQLIGKTDYQV